MTMTKEDAEISLAQRGLKLLYVPGNERANAEAKLITLDGRDTGLAIQFAGNWFVATEYRQGDGKPGPIHLGGSHRELVAALADCLTWHDLNGKASLEQGRWRRYRFPTFRNHREVVCFNCDTALAGFHYSDMGFAPGRGQYTQECGKCALRTWYDLEPTED